MNTNQTIQTLLLALIAIGVWVAALSIPSFPTTLGDAERPSVPIVAVAQTGMVTNDVKVVMDIPFIGVSLDSKETINVKHDGPIDAEIFNATPLEVRPVQ